MASNLSIGNLAVGGSNTSPANSTGAPEVILEGTTPLIAFRNETGGTDDYVVMNETGAFKIKNDTDNSTPLTISSGGIASFSNGIAFQSATTGSGTGTGYTLDSYEEGTWTPTISFDAGTTGITYNTGSTDAIYTRIGNYVWCDFVVQLTSKGSDTGQMRLAGLPFTSSDYSSGTSLDYVGSNLLFTNVSGTDNGAYCSVLGNTTTGYFYDSSQGATIIDTNITDTTMIRGGVRYRVA